MGFKVIIKTDRSIWAGKINRGIENAVEKLANQMLSDSTEFVPKEENTLRDSGRVEPGSRVGEKLLTWTTPYALPQWYGVIRGSPVVNYTTPGTTKMWVDAAKAQSKEKWETVAQNAFTEGMKNAE